MGSDQILQRPEYTRERNIITCDIFHDGFWASNK
jgi:hypothetical protein